MGNLLTDNRALASINTIIMIGLSLYVLSAILPGAFDNFFNTSTASWDSGTASLWVIIPLVVVVAVLLAYLPRDTSGG